MIHLLWPTVRPAMMEDTYAHWWRNAANKQFKIMIAVNTADQKKAIKIPNADIIITGNKRGVTGPCHAMAQRVDGPDSDIIVLASDDFYAPKDWDAWLVDFLANKTAAVRVNDGYHIQDSLTIPIMTMGCLKKLNRFIYHPSYVHQYSDTELFHNLKDLDLLLDAWKTSPVFEHKNWAMKKRAIDEHDQHYINVVSRDANNWAVRSKLPVADRLC